MVFLWLMYLFIHLMGDEHTKRLYYIYIVNNIKGENMIKLKIPVNKTEELVIVSHKDTVNIEKYKGDQRVEVPLKDIPRIIDALIFVDTQENKYPK